MKSIWIVLGRDSEFGKSHVVEHLYVFESSFDAYKFVNSTKGYDHLPEIAHTVVWQVAEHPINENKIGPLNEFNDIYRIRDVIEQAEGGKDD